MNREGKVLAIIGAQFGSEGKGAIVSHLANDYGVHVRVGGPNAGHTIFHEGKEYKMQIIPCGWTNPHAKLVIGRGALVNMELLIQELEMVEQVMPVKGRLYIDAYAGVLDPKFAKKEGHTEGELHQRIGSTGEGVGEARIARIQRNPEEFKQVKDVAEYYGLTRCLKDTVLHLASWHMYEKENILLEGTQGSGLSLIHGPWPYVTSADTNAAQLISDVGISPRWLNQIMLVARTYPIRVAGNSGPLTNEISWDKLSDRVGKQIIERTTVTKKVRRIGEWDYDLIGRAVMINQPTSIVLTFLDYLCPQDEGKTKMAQLSNQAIRFIDQVEYTTGCPVSIVKTGQGNECIIRKREDI